MRSPHHAAEILHSSIFKILEVLFFLSVQVEAETAKGDLLHEVTASSKGEGTNTKEIKRRSVPVFSLKYFLFP